MVTKLKFCRMLDWFYSSCLVQFFDDHHAKSLFSPFDQSLWGLLWLWFNLIDDWEKWNDVRISTGVTRIHFWSKAELEKKMEMWKAKNLFHQGDVNHWITNLEALVPLQSSVTDLIKKRILHKLVFSYNCLISMPLALLSHNILTTLLLEEKRKKSFFRINNALSSSRVSRQKRPKKVPVKKRKNI